VNGSIESVVINEHNKFSILDAGCSFSAERSEAGGPAACYS